MEKSSPAPDGITTGYQLFSAISLPAKESASFNQRTEGVSSGKDASEI